MVPTKDKEEETLTGTVVGVLITLLWCAWSPCLHFVRHNDTTLGMVPHDRSTIAYARYTVRCDLRLCSPHCRSHVRSGISRGYSLSKLG
jgi:hypothetical protein